MSCINGPKYSDLVSAPEVFKMGGDESSVDGCIAYMVADNILFIFLESCLDLPPVH